jgi:hypothetical protein
MLVRKHLRHVEQAVFAEPDLKTVPVNVQPHVSNIFLPNGAAEGLEVSAA